jgi:hypothetical protein
MVPLSPPLVLPAIVTFSVGIVLAELKLLPHSNIIADPAKSYINKTSKEVKLNVFE